MKKKTSGASTHKIITTLSNFFPKSIKMLSLIHYMSLSCEIASKNHLTLLLKRNLKLRHVIHLDSIEPNFSMLIKIKRKYCYKHKEHTIHQLSNLG